MVVHQHQRQGVLTSRGTRWIPGACTAKTGSQYRTPVWLPTENGDIKQTTSAQVYINEFKEVCIKGGIHNDFTKFTLLERGLKEEAIQGMANDESTTFAQLCQAAIQTDERLQGLKTWSNPTKTKKKIGSSSCSQGEKVDNSKYKLTEEEKKEHMDKKLCFKCHQKDHLSRECKNPHTVYSEVKKKTSVTNIEAKGKGKDKAKTPKTMIKEVKAKDESDTVANTDGEEEDFTDGNWRPPLLSPPYVNL